VHPFRLGESLRNQGLRDTMTRYRRFRDWVRADVFARLFAAISDEPDMEYAMVDATIVKLNFALILT
jgi:hypothetical protein